MKKTIPFKKQLQFKTNVAEITSISLENTLHTNKQTIEGELITSGTYKITETSTETEHFEFQIPINIEMDNKYDVEKIIIDINDFYYEVINSNILEVNIEILLDNIIENPILEEKKEEIIEESIKQEPQKDEINKLKMEEKEMREDPKETRCIEEEQEEQIETQNKMQTKQEINIFENITEEKEPYSTYHIYIVREGDNIETIMAKYNVTRENLSEYNDITELKLGDKIIIPEINARD